jgi:anti-sigma B factor antagonist
VSSALDQADELLVVDLTGVSFLGSHGLAALVGAAQESASSRYKDPMRLVVDSNRPVVRPLQVTGLDEVLALYPSVEEALV